MEFILLLILFILLLGLITNYLINIDISKKKGYENLKYLKLKAFIPVYGNLYVSLLKNLKPEISDVEIKHLTSFEVIIKKLGLVFIFLTLIFIILIPISTLVYLSFTHNFTRTALTLFLIIVLFLVHQSLVVEYAKKKGYEGIEPGLIGLIPVYGFIHFNLKPKRRNISDKALKNTFSLKSILGKLLLNAELTLLVIIVLVPIIFIFGMAFSPTKNVVPSRIWPKEPTLAGFQFLFNKDSNFTKWYGNTLIIAVINMLVGTVIITGASYVFARFQFKGKKAGLLSILVLQAFPSFMGLVAMFVLFWKFGLLGRPIYLTILYIGGAIPGNLWLIKGFLSQIPRDLDESAMIDGASKLKIFIHIILPLSIPILTFVAVSMFMAPWMDYMLPGYLLNVPAPGMSLDRVPEQWTLAVGIFSFISGQYDLNYPAFAAASLIVGLPIAVIYMIFQRYLIEGIMAGATKG